MSRRRRRPIDVTTFALAGIVLVGTPLAAEPRRVDFTNDHLRLSLEVDDDDLIHFEYAPRDVKAHAAIARSPMIAKSDYPGPNRFELHENELATGELRLVVDASTLCFDAIDQARGFKMSRICPSQKTRESWGLTLTPERARNVYGLGEQFTVPGTADGDWLHRVRTPGNDYGNAMVSYEGGAVGNAMFPIMYALSEGKRGFALMLDSFQWQQWDFASDPWHVTLRDDRVRGYLIAGPDLRDLRRDYMELTGKPPVPPKKVFGLWISEYGYDNWTELSTKLAGLRAQHFPVDGFVLDLQWFGGIEAGSEQTRMGSLDWDYVNFPDPAGMMKKLHKQGVGLITIEESYVGEALDEHASLAAQGFLVKACEGCEPVKLTTNPWWGIGGMIDWTNPAAADYWHDEKRKKLIDAGVVGHWTDLGEPEIFAANGWYHGLAGLDRHSHRDVHNIYNFKWLESIHRGYERHGERQRPFMMSRSGTSGIQRFGASMWSGDIGSNLQSLATHHNAQMHMSLSGIDYFGSDVGGFHRKALRGDLAEAYTQWFATSSLLDVPLRPHTENLCNCKETSPDRIGDKNSNLANVRLRYRLAPYLYSLAELAHTEGEAVFPPLVYYYQDDANVRTLGHEKMIGPSLLAGIVARHGEYQRDIYLPAGGWYDFHSNAHHTSRGDWLRNVSEYRDGIFSLPLFAKAGALVPMMKVDENTMNVFGQRLDGTTVNDLVVRAFYGEGHEEFSLYEDDGVTIDYLGGEWRKTKLSQDSTPEQTVIGIGSAEGSYGDDMTSRVKIVELVTPGKMPTAAYLDGAALRRVDSREAFESCQQCWWLKDDREIRLKSSEQGLKQAASFSVDWAH